MSAFDVLRDRIEAATGYTPRGRGPRWSFRCPAHGDNGPSLSVRELDDRVLVHCFAGCTVDDVLASLELARRDLFDDPRRGKARHLRLVPPLPPVDPGWTYVNEPPDLPDVTKRAAYNASTAYVEIGHHPGGPVPAW